MFNMYSNTIPKSIICNIFLIFILSFSTLLSQTIGIQGLEKDVEILVDKWGIPHIYAKTESDLFFAQGYYAARDRLFQFEIWRRQSSGTVAELLGHRELKRDIGTRLFKFRGDMVEEMNYYHPHGAKIITSYVRGVNAYIDYILAHQDELPIEFKLLNTLPQKWTPEIVISRHQGLLGNISAELLVSRMIALVGEEKVRELFFFHPKKPMLQLDDRIEKDWLFEDILELYSAYRTSVKFTKEDLVSYHTPDGYDPEPYTPDYQFSEFFDIGSNNWIVDGSKTQSGYPIMANDPHRRQSTPSLRYMAHLVGPGWNVIGGGEPEIPGISIGHNEHGAWGLTVYSTDAEDLYFYELNPNDPTEYKYQGNWSKMDRIEDTIRVKDMDDQYVTHYYTIHGPVLYSNQDKGFACAMRCGWLEIGGSPYLASLRMDQAHDFESFREACNYSHIPGENMIWADKAGNIGWQAVGIAPVRKNWSGLTAVWGDGSYEWDHYLPIIAKPNIYNPVEGYFVTANANVTPQDYTHWNAIGFQWSDPFRQNRLAEYFNSGRKVSMLDMAQLQTDYLSLPARMLTPLLLSCTPSNKRQLEAFDLLRSWDYRLSPDSRAASIYNSWEGIMRKTLALKKIPKEAQQYLSSIQMTKIIEWIVYPDEVFGSEPVQGRNKFLLDCLDEALNELTERLGSDMQQWIYGQIKNKHVYLRHPFNNAVNKELRDKLNVGPAPRGGNSFTVNNTSGNLNQTHGASFKIIVDTDDWDHCLATNSPGQSGNPDSKFYNNLFDIWVNDQYFPLFYTRNKVEAVTDHLITLKAQ